MKVVIVGNGILALMTAYRLVRRDRAARVVVIGPKAREGCATLAAAAMFNSFCEVDANTFSNKFETEKFLFNKSATKKWPSLIKSLETESKIKQECGFGTYLINNHAADDLEDRNFEAIVSALRRFKEPFADVEPRKIPHYKPSSAGRAARALFIPGEGWINPRTLIAALEKVLMDCRRAEFLDDRCLSLRASGGKIAGALLESGGAVSGDRTLLAPGAVFSKIVDKSNLGLKMPKIFYGVGASLLLKTDENTLGNCVRTPNRGLACGVYAAPRGPRHTLIGASNFITGRPENFARIGSAYALLGAAMNQINSDYYRSQLVAVNVGWRPTSEDTLPLIGGTSIRDLFVATGTKRDGLHCSPVISEYLADLILEGASRQKLDLFKPERKPVRIYTRKEAVALGVRSAINAHYQHGFQPSHNRIVEDLEAAYQADLEKLHDAAGAADWGIPPEMIGLYRWNKKI